MTLLAFPELRKLSNNQKLTLADELWQAGMRDSLPVSAAQKRMLGSRWKAYKSGAIKRISIEELTRRLENK
jgi:putative addiction module component (TIGR02574 family)